LNCLCDQLIHCSLYIPMTMSLCDQYTAACTYQWQCLCDRYTAHTDDNVSNEHKKTQIWQFPDVANLRWQVRDRLTDLDRTSVVKTSPTIQSLKPTAPDWIKSQHNLSHTVRHVTNRTNRTRTRTRTASFKWSTKNRLNSKGRYSRTFNRTLAHYEQHKAYVIRYTAALTETLPLPGDYKTWLKNVRTYLFDPFKWQQ